MLYNNPYMIPTNPIAAIVLIAVTAIKAIGSLADNKQDGDNVNDSDNS